MWLFVFHPLQGAAAAAAAAAASVDDTTPTRISNINDDDNKLILSSLKYQQILGQGSYKTVYLVAASESSTIDSSSSWAVAVEKIKSKKDAKKALRGIQIVDELQTKLREGGDQDYINSFEQIQYWWFQSTPLPPFQVNQQVFFHLDNHHDVERRSQKVPTKFLGRTKYLISLKPVYDIDLQRLTEEKSATLYPVPSAAPSTTKNTTNNHRMIGGIDLNNPTSAIRLAYELCDIGRVMHLYGLIHRDIKGE